jgi:hypothetical protein
MPWLGSADGDPAGLGPEVGEGLAGTNADNPSGELPPTYTGGLGELLPKAARPRGDVPTPIGGLKEVDREGDGDAPKCPEAMLAPVFGRKTRAAAGGVGVLPDTCTDNLRPAVCAPAPAPVVEAVGG